MKTKSFTLLLFFISLPLYLTDDFRINLGGVTITINLIILLFLFILIIGFKHQIRIDKNSLTFFVLLTLLLVVHSTGYRSYVDTFIYLKYLLKFFVLLTVTFSSYLVGRLFLKDIHELNNSLYIFIISSAIVIIYLIFYYLSLKALFLGNKFFNPEMTTSGKNQFQIYLAITTPLIFYLLACYKTILKKLPLLLAFLVHAIAIVYVGSRGLWISIFLTAFIYLFIRFFKIIFSYKIKKKYLFNMLLFFTFLLFFSQVIKNFETSHVLMKIQSLFNIFKYGSSNIDVSMNERSLLLNFSIENLSNNPINLIFGNGLGAFQTMNPFGKLTHNDFMFFLFDLGVLGFAFFVTVNILIIIEFKKRKLPYYLYLPYLLDLLFINAYNIPIFWIITGLFIGITTKRNEIEFN